MEKWICPFCNAEHDGSYRFCPICGCPNPGNDAELPDVSSTEKSSESTLVFIGKLVYGFSILLGVVTVVVGLLSYDFSLGVYCMLLAVALLVWAKMSYYLLKVICNISNTLKSINRKLK